MIIFLLIFLMMQLIHILKKWRSVFHYSLVVWSVFRNWRVLGLCLSHHLPWLGLILPSARYVTCVVSDIQSTLSHLSPFCRGREGVGRVGRMGEQKMAILVCCDLAWAEQRLGIWNCKYRLTQLHIPGLFRNSSISSTLIKIISKL